VQPTGNTGTLQGRDSVLQRGTSVEVFGMTVRKRTLHVLRGLAFLALLGIGTGRAIGGPSLIEYGNENLLNTGTYPSDP
jgi:hypothetical protein